MKKVILAIEDFADQALWLSTVLGKVYELRIVQNLVQARRELLTYTPDLILLDASLPDGDGFTFCAWLQADRRYAAIPVFLFTARLEEEERQFGLRQGAKEYLVKPLRADLLRAKLAEYLGGAEASAAAYPTAKLSTVVDSPEDYTDREIASGRPLAAPAEELFRAFADEARRASWWPQGRAALPFLTERTGRRLHAATEQAAGFNVRLDPAGSQTSVTLRSLFKSREACENARSETVTFHDEILAALAAYAARSL